MTWTPDNQGRPWKDERAVLRELEDYLLRERPLPAPAFRGNLRRHLLSGTVVPVGDRPKRFKTLIVTFATSGATLLAVAVVGVAGAGPFAA